jgi:transcriptional regulator with XRE-family HTH domain
MNYHQAFKKIRDYKKLTQSQMAEFADVSPGYISKIEKGERVPTLEVIEKICKATNIPFTLFALFSMDDGHLDRVTRDDIDSIRTNLLELLPNDHKPAIIR